MNIKFSSLLVVASLFAGQVSAEPSEPCVFDHQILTVPPSTYKNLEAFFKGRVAVSLGVTVTQEPSHREKFFATFLDGTYLEVGQSSDPSSAAFGHQEVCRVEEVSSLDTIARRLDADAMDPRGDVFFAWRPGQNVDLNLPGIRRILKSPAHPQVENDYLAGGLIVAKQPGGEVIFATDRLGIRRVAVKSLSEENNALIAVRIAFPSPKSRQVKIEGEPNMFVDLRSHSATFVFRADLYKKYSPLLDL